MNENEQIEQVLGGEKSASGKGGADDKDARIAELERELNNERVERGRNKVLSDELAALREENAKLKTMNGVDAAIASVPEEIRNDIAPEVLKASGAMAASVSERMSRDFEKQQEEIRMLREENARRDRNWLTQRINMRFPGFLDSVATGGAKHDAWIKYQKFNAASIVGALKANDFETLAYHIEMFFREIGIQVPSGEQDGSAAPDPRSHGGGTGSESTVSGKIYTMDEYNDLFDQKEAARDRGDWAEVKRISDEINRALADGRIRKD